MTLQPLGNTNLFKPIQIGRYTVAHRVVLAPLTRFRNDAQQAPTSMAVEYYGQRAAYPGTLLINEATFITPQAGGYDLAPGVWSSEQIEAWRAVIARVHEAKSFFFVQLWHLGRSASAEALKARGLPYVSASAVYQTPDHEKVALALNNELRAMTHAEVKQTVRDYAQAARNSIEAGADGVEIHGANGYLIDQFLQEASNQRTDEYGGSIENRARFALEVVEAVVEAVGADRTGIRFSPWSVFQGLEGALYNPEATFGYLLEQIERKYPLAYVHLVEPRFGRGSAVEGVGKGRVEGSNEFAYKAWSGPIIRAGAYHEDDSALRKDVEDARTMIAFGRSFIANPDLPRRLAEGWPLAPYDRDTFYTAGAEGYTDYPEYQQ